MSKPVRAADIEVGYTLPAATHGPVDRLNLALFAAYSGDHNPIHLDDEQARASGLPGAIVHGMLSMAFLAQLLTAWVPQSQVKSFGSRFAAMAYPGDSILCKGVVAGKEVIDGQTVVEITLTAENQKGDGLLSGSAKVALI